MHRDKYYCAEHDWAAKGPCPRQHAPGAPAGARHSSWRPGRKGSRTRLWDDRVARRGKLRKDSFKRLLRAVYPYH